jgi:phosphoglycolate phosphatase-like HAD superfamily hydrolase
MRLVLFDVDGTLISTKGAGMRAFYRALQGLFGISVENEVIRPDGMTDPLILKALLAHFGMADQWCTQTQETLFACYLNCLEDEMSRARERGQIRILPGVVNLLETLAFMDDFCVGLATGNLEKGAQIKLDKAGLSKYFRFGGYGSDCENRTSLVRIGIERGARIIAPATVEEAFVIGDTLLDIVHGRAAGARTIAVASARYGVNDLSRENPDLVVADLTAIDSIVSFMRDPGSSGI